MDLHFPEYESETASITSGERRSDEPPPINNYWKGRIA